jgi:prolyl oligopeptidase
MQIPNKAAAVVAGVAVVGAFLAGVATVNNKQAYAKKKYTYPEAMKQDVVDDYHGTKVADPYRWLEDPDAPETQAWVAKENELTREYIDSYDKREAIEARLTRLWNYPKYSLPVRHGDRYFFSKNDGLQNQSVLYVKESLDGDARLLLDPNKLSEDGTIALTGTHYTKDGALMAYGTSASGSDRQTLHVRDVTTGEDLSDEIKWCRFAGVGWKKDKSGFWYNRFPADGEVAPEDMTNYSRIYWHTLGTPQSEDRVVLEDPANKEHGFYPGVTDDGEYLVIVLYHGTDPQNGVLVRKTDSDGDFTAIVGLETGMFNPIDNVGSTLYFHTDFEAPRGRIIAVDLNNPERENWKEIVAETKDVIDGVTMVNNQFVVNYMQDAKNTLVLYAADGKRSGDIPMPTIGSVGGISGSREDKEMFYSFTSFTYPTTSFRYDFTSGKSTVYQKSDIDFDGSKYETKQVFYPSRDGTKIPMFLTYKKGMKQDGKNPTLLYGYGGFNISITPTFSISRLVWMENGGILAVANLRGGNEYGEEWHQQGILDRKQNVFDDFIAAGEYLIKEKYTQKKFLAINGGSNGGLLTAACALQRPDLWGAVVCQVPVIDMLRYQLFTVGRYWVSDYGNAENAEDFKYLYAYSPLHNVPDGFKSPPMLITSADTDDRVVPSHAKKFAATLQEKDAGENPILLRVETKAGHGAGKPTSKQIEEAADIYSFLFKTMGVKPSV